MRRVVAGWRPAGQLGMIIGALIGTHPSALAGDLTLIGQATSLGAFKQLLPRFEGQSGDRVESAFSNPGTTMERLRANSTVDVIVISSAYWNVAIESGWVDASTRIPLGQTRIGIGVRAGGRSASFKDAASFKAFLRTVKTIGLVRSVGGAGTAPMFIKAVEALGLGDEMAPKYRFFPGAGSAVADAIGSGEVDCGATALSELIPNKAVHIVGPIPTDVIPSSATTYAVIGSHAEHRAEAEKFLQFLTTAESKTVFQDIGLLPP